MTYLGQSGPSDRHTRHRFRARDWSDERGALAALFGVFLLGVIALYVFGGADRPMLATGPADETSGQSTRPALPALPQ
jgi:hypothetical protein